MPPTSRRLAVVACAALGACAAEAPGAPPAEFLVAAGDSTFWVASDTGPARVRGAPLRLVRVGARFLEVYVTDADRSHRDAVFVGTFLWARDLVAGDSILLAVDTSVLALEREYARRTPWDPPVQTGEDVAEQPSVDATTDLVPLESVGPYLSVRFRRDVEAADSTRHRHEVRHGVVDLRRGRRVSLAELLGERAATVVAEGERAWRQARDSVHAERSEAGRAAEAALDDFPFDPASWALVARRDTVAVQFTAPGRGGRSGGYLLHLTPVPVGAPSWWPPDARGEVPADSGTVLRWPNAGYDVLAVPDSSGDRATLIVRRPGTAGAVVARVPRPVHRIIRLDAPAVDAPTRAALRRAFDEATLLGEGVRTAALPRPRATPALPASVR